MTTRYASWADVFDYCRRSANPVGRLVLRIGGYRDDALDRSSDALCTALQLTNFWQDFGRDWRPAGCTCRARSRALRRCRNRARGRTHHRRMGRAFEACVPQSPARGSTRAARMRRRDRPARAWSCGSPGSAARSFWSASSGMRDQLLDVDRRSAQATCRGCLACGPVEKHRDGDGAENQLLLFVSGSSRRAAACDHCRLGLLPRG